MAEKKDNKSMEEEKKIPVFTVLKNGSIFKNIFLLDSPPPISEPKLIESSENSNTSCQEKDEILLIGRHPDCNIMLEHPSIGRLHLRICLQPTLQKLSVMDLSSGNSFPLASTFVPPSIQICLWVFSFQLEFLIFPSGSSFLRDTTFLSPFVFQVSFSGFSL